MKVGILRVPVGIGGAEMSLTEIGSNLSKLGHNVWVHFDKGNHSTTKSFNKFGNLDKRCSDDAKKFFKEDSFSEAWAIKQLADTDVVFVIHRHLFGKGLAYAVNNVKRKIIYCPGKNTHHVYGEAAGIDAYGGSIENISKFIFNSKHTLSLHMKKDYPDSLKSRFTHFHPPMDIGFYEKFNFSRLRLDGRGELGLGPSDFAIGVFGRIIPSKRPESVIRIARKFRDANPLIPFKIYFIGDGPKRGVIDEQIKINNLNENVEILGMKNDPFKYVSSMDCMLHMCEHESMSRALRESMFFGRPIVAYNGAGNKELCSGKCANLLFKNHDDALKILTYLAENGRDRGFYSDLSKKRLYDLEKSAVLGLKRILL